MYTDISLEAKKAYETDQEITSENGVSSLENKKLRSISQTAQYTFRPFRA